MLIFPVGYGYKQGEQGEHEFPKECFVQDGGSRAWQGAQLSLRPFPRVLGTKPAWCQTQPLPCSAVAGDPCDIACRSPPPACCHPPIPTVHRRDPAGSSRAARRADLGQRPRPHKTTE